MGFPGVAAGGPVWGRQRAGAQGGRGHQLPSAPRTACLPGLGWLHWEPAGRGSARAPRAGVGVGKGVARAAGAPPGPWVSPGSGSSGCVFTALPW